MHFFKNSQNKIIKIYLGLLIQKITILYLNIVCYDIILKIIILILKFKSKFDAFFMSQL